MKAITTLGAYAYHWLEGTRRRKPRTRETYANTLRLHWFPALGEEMPLATITRTGIRDVLFAKIDAGYAIGSVLLMLKVIRGLLAAACLEDVIARNPALGVSRLLPPRVAVQAQRAIRREPLRHFLAMAHAVHPALSALFVVGARTGLRLGELLALRWDDVDLERGIVTVMRTIDWRRREGTPKGQRTSVLPLSPQAVDALRALRTTDATGCVWIFHGPSGRPWSRTHVWRTMDRACRRAGIPHASAHALRHSFITQVAEVAGTPWEVRDLARHSSITETEPYLHLNLRYRASVDALDD